MTIVHDDEFCLNLLNDALRALRGNKQSVKDPQEARYWAVTVTELEKVVAYFETYVVDEGLHSGESGLTQRAVDVATHPACLCPSYPLVQSPDCPVHNDPPRN